MVFLLMMCLGGAFIQRTTGFGFGIFVMTVLPYLMPSYAEAATLSSMLAALTSIMVVVRHWRYIEWRMLLPVLITFLIVSWLFVGVMASTDSTILRRALGVMLIMASVWFAFLKDRVRLRPTIPVQLTVGSLSGLMGGLFSMQGPPVVLYFVATTRTKEAYIALAQTYFLIGNLSMTAFRAARGLVTTTVLQSWCMAVPVVMLGTWIGSKVFDRLSLPHLRNFIYLYMAISGLIALVS